MFAFPLLDRAWPWVVTVGMLQQWRVEFPAIDVRATCAAAHDRYLRYPTNQRTYRDIRRWLLATLAKEVQLQAQRGRMPVASPPRCPAPPPDTPLAAQLVDLARAFFQARSFTSSSSATEFFGAHVESAGLGPVDPLLLREVVWQVRV